MKDKEKLFIAQIEDILEKYNEYQTDKKEHHHNFNENQIVNNLIARILAIIERITGNNSEYYKRSLGILTQYKIYNDHVKLEPLVGVLDGLYQDLKRGFLKNLSELLNAEIFSDYIEMAEHLLNEGYKDPAAIITGSTLEEHLRRLCQKNKIEYELIVNGNKRPKKADLLNSELAKDNVYDKLEQKSITSWLDLRNKAAHGHYDDYDNKQVKLLIMGVREFIKRNPA